MSFPATPVSTSLPGPPISTLASVFPVNVSPRLPPVTFSIAEAEARDSVRLAFTTWAVVSPRLRAIDCPAVAEKSRVSIPALSLTVSLPRATSASNR